MSGPAIGVDLCGLELRGPVINGSGTFDALAAGDIFGRDALAPERFPFAAYVSKTITHETRAGNPPFRTWEAPAGMINSIGLPNPGIESFIGSHLPGLRAIPVPLIVSVMAEDREGFARLVDGLGSAGGIDAFELNVSCPNVHSGLIVGEQPDETVSLLEHLRPLTDRPLIVKLTPNVADPGSIAEAAEAGGADAVSLVNTIKATAFDPAHDRPWLGAGSGGLSGPAIRPIALQQVASVSRRVGIPVVGMGGVTDGESALDFIRAGATAVAVGTENFRDPLAGRRVTEELVSALERRGISDLSAVRGSSLG